MDEVDVRYRDDIMEALQVRNVGRLMELVPGMNYERANDCIDRWQENYGMMMAKTRLGEDTTELERESINMLEDLVEEANLQQNRKSF